MGVKGKRGVKGGRVLYDPPYLSREWLSVNSVYAENNYARIQKDVYIVIKIQRLLRNIFRVNDYD